MKNFRYIFLGLFIFAGMQEKICPTNQPTNQPTNHKSLTPTQKQQAKSPKAITKTSPKKAPESKSDMHQKLIQDFLTAAKKLPELKTNKDHDSKNTYDHESPEIKKEVAKVYEAYSKMQAHVKDITLTTSQEKILRKAANKLFNYRVAEQNPIRHKAWKGYKVTPDQKKSDQQVTTQTNATDNVVIQSTDESEGEACPDGNSSCSSGICCQGYCATCQQTSCYCGGIYIEPGLNCCNNIPTPIDESCKQIICQSHQQACGTKCCPSGYACTLIDGCCPSANVCGPQCCQNGYICSNYNCIKIT